MFTRTRNLVHAAIDASAVVLALVVATIFFALGAAPYAFFARSLGDRGVSSWSPQRPVRACCRYCTKCECYPICECGPGAQGDLQP